MRQNILLILLLTAVLGACASTPRTSVPTPSPTHLCLAPNCGSNFRVTAEYDASVDNTYGWNIQITSDSVTQEEIQVIADSFASLRDGRKFMVFYRTFEGGFGTIPITLDSPLRPQPLSGRPWLATLDYMGDELVYEN